MLRKALQNKDLKEQPLQAPLNTKFFKIGTLPLKNDSFLTKITSSQNLKVAIYKGFPVCKKTKIGKKPGS